MSYCHLLEFQAPEFFLGQGFSFRFLGRKAGHKEALSCLVDCHDRVGLLAAYPNLDLLTHLQTYANLEQI